MAVGALDKEWSKGKYQQLIDDINYAVSKGTIASASADVTTALADLATERDKH